MKKEKRNISLLFFSLVVVMLGFGMIIPILPFYIEHFGASGGALGGLMAIYAVMQFLFAPVWGKLSDQVGRKPILLIGVLGNAATQLMFGLSTQLWMLFIARGLAGILSSATFPTVMAYIGDSTSEEDRGGGMGIMGAAMGVGMVLGPGMGGWLAEYSLAWPFFLAAGLSAAALVLVYFFLPESLDPENRETANLTEVRALFVGMWDALFGPIGFLLVMAFLVSFGLTNFEAIFGLYSLHKFNYGPQEVGGILTFIGLVSAIVQGILTGPLTKRWGEGKVIIWSLAASTGAFIFMLLANSLYTILLTVGFFVVSNAMLRPAVSSLTSKRATQGQGISMGLNNAFMSLGRIAGPILAGFLFDIEIYLPYMAGAVIMLLGYIFGLGWFNTNRPVEKISKELFS